MNTHESSELAGPMAEISAGQTCALDTCMDSSRAEEVPSPPRRGKWELAGLICLLLLTAGLRLWHLGQNGYGHPYYAATVRSMLVNWHNFFYASFDPAGFISVDKPPVAFWIQTAVARLIGFGGYAVHLPQAIEGTLIVLLVYALVRRPFGAPAGLIAGLVAALVPISVAVDRSNLPDTCLVFFLVLAAWALSRAAQTGRLAVLLLAMALVGVAFNAKLTAACLVLPAFYLVYVVGAPVRWWKRFVHLGAASVVLVAVALSWSVIVDLTPADQRPYVGDTQDNSMLTMAVGTSGPFSGIGRILGGFRGRQPGRPDGPPGAPSSPRNAPGPRPEAGRPPEGMRGPEPGFLPMPPGAGAFPGGFPGAPPGFGPPGAGPPGGGPPGTGRGGFAPPGAGPGGFGPPGGRGSIGFAGPPGIPRLFAKHMVEQVFWLLPLTILGFFVAIVQARWQWPLAPQHEALLLWGGWLVTGMAVLSYMQGVVHNYYLLLLAPPVAALAGISWAALRRVYLQRRWLSLLLPLALSLTAVWEAHLLKNHTGWPERLLPWLLDAAGTAAVALIAVRISAFRWHAWRGAATAIAIAGFLAILICPTAWALTPVIARGNGHLPMAYPGLVSGEEAAEPMAALKPGAKHKLIEFLRANNHGERYFLMTRDIHFAAAMIIQTGEPVIAPGGFLGSDPALTLERFKQWVADGQLRFVMMEGFRGGFGFGPPGFGPPGAGFPGPMPFGLDGQRPGGDRRGDRNPDASMPRQRRPGGPGFAGMGPFGRGGGLSGILEWVREHGQMVPSDRWDDPMRAMEMPGDSPRRPFRGRGFPPGGFGGPQSLYDCRPEAGILAPGAK